MIQYDRAYTDGSVATHGRAMRGGDSHLVVSATDRYP